MAVSLMLLLNTTEGWLQLKVYPDDESPFVASADESSVMTHILETICVLYQLFNLLASCFVSPAVLFQQQLNLLSLYHLETSAASNESTRETWLGMRTLRGWWWYKLTLSGDNDDYYEDNDGGHGERNLPYVKWISQVDQQVCSCNWPEFCHHHHQYQQYQQYQQVIGL